MSFVVTSSNIRDLDVTQASVYMDACFILAALNIDDNRHDRVMDVLDRLSDRGVRWVTSNHISSEVVDNLFKIKVLRALQIYHEKIAYLQGRHKGVLTKQDRMELVDENAARDFYNLLRKHGLLNFRGKYAQGNAYEIVKFIKRFPHLRRTLQVYYKSAVTTYRGFIRMLADYDIRAEHAPSDQSIELLALAYTHLHRLDMPDALHLAVARWSDCDYFLTLDGDFESAYFEEDTLQDSADPQIEELLQVKPPHMEQDRILTILKIA